VSIGILEKMTSLDFKSPFDELTELRAVLTTQEIADLTGLRRETISRARPDSRFQRRTENALRDLCVVVTKMRSVAGQDLNQLAAILRRPQAELGGHSIAELLREGRVDVVLGSLSSDAPAEVAEDPDLDQRVAALLKGDLELRSRLGAIEAALVEHFGPGARVERDVISDYDAPERSEVLYLRVYSALSLDENMDRLGEFLQREQNLLAPVLAQLVIGFL
jgi:hypothetical protein